MERGVFITETRVLDDLSKAVDNLARDIENVDLQKDREIQIVLADLKQMGTKLDAAVMKHDGEYRLWSSRIGMSDDEGHSRYPEAREKTEEADAKKKKCENLKKGCIMHMQTLGERARIRNIGNIKELNTDAKRFLRERQTHIRDYNIAASGGFVAGTTAIGRSNCNPNAMESSVERYPTHKLWRFKDRNVLRTDINWNYVSGGRTNLDRALGGSAPLSGDGKPIMLHHIGQDPNGMLAEVPARLHNSGRYNLHRMYTDKISFRKDPSLDKAFNAFRSKYWMARARDYLEM